jgi:SNF2 family DNA or RNA helicase
MPHGTAAPAFEFLTQPRAHQLREWERHRAERNWALFHEQRTGKTKIVLDEAAWNYHQGNIDTLLVIAPKGVHRNWITDEVPAHLHPSTNYCALQWTGAGTKAWERQFTQAMNNPGLLVFSFNIEALLTPRLKAHLALIFNSGRKVMAVVDESQIIKTPGAKRTALIRRIGVRSRMKRILSGTPVTQSPLDLYNQMYFLDWRILGFSTHAEFKAYYAEWETEHNHNTDTDYKVLKNYKNLDEMKTRLAKVSSRVLRSDCMDLPPKIYQKKYFDLSKDLRRTYDQLREEYMAELRGVKHTVAHALARMMRLQQICSNFFPNIMEVTTCPHCYGDGCEHCDGGYYFPPQTYQRIDEKHHPRLEALEEILQEEQPEKVVIWCRFDRDIDDVISLLIRLGRGMPARYDGKVKERKRAADLSDFQSGKIRDLVAKPNSGGRGLNMSAARLEIYYTNLFSLEVRLQSEDRLESLDATRGPTSIIDLVCQDTVDERVVTALREKKALADMITGDDPREWL